MPRQLYVFAHQLLPHTMLRDALMWWAVPDDQRQEMLRKTWDIAGEGLAPGDRADGSTLQLRQVAAAPDLEALVVTLPPPEAPTECFAVALVRLGRGMPRYFTAERKADPPGSPPRAYWGEWYMNGDTTMHLRGADLPEPSAEALLAVAAAECRENPDAYVKRQIALEGLSTRAPGASPPRGGAPAKAGSKSLRIAIAVALVLLVLVGGYLFYDENRGARLITDEVASVPIQPGQPFSVQFKWEGSGFAFNNVWLVVEDGKRSGGEFKARSKVMCSTSTSPRENDVALDRYDAQRVETRSGDAFSAWFFLTNEYKRGSSGTITCAGTVTPARGTWTRARVVVTQRQRPSEYLRP
jgi:hypothetical protein